MTAVYNSKFYDRSKSLWLDLRLIVAYFMIPKIYDLYYSFFRGISFIDIIIP